MEPFSPAVRHEPCRPLRVEGVRGERGERYFLGYAANLSKSGIFVQCSAPRPRGSLLRLALHLPLVPSRVLFSNAEVCCVRSYSGRRGPAAGMGLELLDLHPSARALLRSYVKQLARRPRGGAVAGDPCAN